jgi:hypothetical protein
MDTIKIKTRVNQDHRIEIENLPFEKGSEVEVTISQSTDIPIIEIMKLEDSGRAYDFLNDEREDIYTVKDLIVKYK